MPSSHVSLLRPSLLLLAGVTACDASTLSGLASCLPFEIPGLTQDAGTGGDILPITGSNVDAAGFFIDPDGGVAGALAQCSDTVPCDSAAGLECLAVTAEQSLCLQRCGVGGACPAGQRCDQLGDRSWCLPERTRGQHCEAAACIPDAGVTCQPARTEGDQVLAWTCQVPCDPAAPACSTGDSCLPAPGGALVDVGACPCTAGGTCTGLDGGNRCLRGPYVCGQPAPLGDPARLGEPGSWDGGSCDPGAGQRFCVTPTPEGAPVFCAQASSPSGTDGVLAVAGVEGLCLAICVDPRHGSSHECPVGTVCNTATTALLDVAPGAPTCEHDGECDVEGGELCAGPLPALGGGFRCARPYGLCSPGGS